VLVEDAADGMHGVSLRGTYLIDPKGAWGDGVAATRPVTSPPLPPPPKPRPCAVHPDQR
jgi:hypothetical protein